MARALCVPLWVNGCSSHTVLLMERRPAHTHSFSVRSVGKVIALATLPSTRSFLEFVLHEQHVVRMHKLSKTRVHLMDRYPWALWLKVPVALSYALAFISFSTHPPCHGLDDGLCCYSFSCSRQLVHRCPCLGCRLGSSHFRVLPQCGYPPIHPEPPPAARAHP